MEIGTQVCIHNVYEGYSHVATPCIGTITCEDPLEVELEDGERIPVDELYITEVTDLEYKFTPVNNNISLKDFKDLWEQLDDYKKVEYLMQALTDSCRYYPEFISPFEILAWKLNLSINPEDREVAKYTENEASNFN